MFPTFSDHHVMNFGVHHITELQLVCEILNEPGRSFPAGASGTVTQMFCTVFV